MVKSIVTGGAGFIGSHICLNLVKKIAWHYHGRVRNIIEIDDLIQIGMIGLVTAANNFIEKPGITFSSYARIRIKGEIVDFLRKNSNNILYYLFYFFVYRFIS